MYVPILKNIKRLCQDKHTLSEFQSSHRGDDNYLRDFCDGTVYKKAQLSHQ
uniref:Uncharacterized protein n=1 Tax=Amphimedon queenslandica TaxID=400682 RepID=A0A1X7TVJ2_AMPQE